MVNVGGWNGEWREQGNTAMWGARSEYFSGLATHSSSSPQYPSTVDCLVDPSLLTSPRLVGTRVRE